MQDRTWRRGWGIRVSALVVAITALLAGGKPAAAGSVVPVAGRAYHLEYRPTRRVSLDLTYTVNNPRVRADEWVLYVPVAPTLEWQTNVTSSAELVTRDGNYALVPMVEKGPQARPVLGIQFDARLTGSDQVYTWRRTIEATVAEVQLTEGPPREPVVPLDEAAREVYRRATPTYDYDAPAFREWCSRVNLWMGQNEALLPFAYRMTQGVIRTLRYANPDGQEWRATEILRAGNGDCSRHAILTTTILRANGIPARTICAFWATTAESRGHHCWTEFYADGIGWVPADASGKQFGYMNGELVAGMVDFDYLLDSVWYGDQMAYQTDFTGAAWLRGEGQPGGRMPRLVRRNRVQMLGRGRA